MGVGQLTEDRIKEIFDAHRHRVEDCDSGIDDDNLLEFVSAILAVQDGGVTEEANLIVGRFYWVIPAFDPDTDADWETSVQPARFAGTNAAGELLWNCLTIDGNSSWPMRWIGGEITPPK
jgi:hypothetical protein